MSIVTDGLDQRREDIKRGFPDSVQVVRITLVPDGAGGMTESEAVNATVNGRVVHRRGYPNEMPVGAVPSAITFWQIYLPYDTDVQPKDVLRTGGKDFEVADDDSLRSNPVCLVVDCTLKRSD